MADRKHGHPIPGTDTEIRHEDWDRQDLSGRAFERVAFVDVDMTESHSEGAVFDTCTFRDVELNASRHTGTAFLNCTFTRSSFFDATFTGCKLTGTMFDRCRFGITRDRRTPGVKPSESSLLKQSFRPCWHSGCATIRPLV